MITSKLFLIIKRIIKSSWNKDITEYLKQFFKLTFHLLKQNGSLYTIRYLKICRLVITRYICGKRLYKVKEFVSIKDGFPARLYFLKPLVDDNIISLKILLTIMNISKTIKAKRGEEFPISLDTITNPYKGKRYTIPAAFIKSFVKDTLGYKEIQHLKPLTSSDFYLSLKQGPHGPTILSVWHTLKYYKHKDIKNLMILAGKDFIEKLFGPFYSFVMHNDVEIPMGPTPNEKKIKNQLTRGGEDLGRLAIIDAPEAKKRVIAIIDYYSQVCLKPLSDKILLLLNSGVLPADRTFTQSPYHKWEGKGKFYSLDLTAATDRIPITLQTKLLNYIFGNEVGEAWKSMFSDRAFSYQGSQYYYSVGQPMGAYSSWALLALTHHLIVHWAAHLCGHAKFNNYILLGDDIVIKDDKVAKKYIAIMTKLGVDISETKTHVSKNTYEFAKRWIRNGQEITGIPLHGIADNIKSPFIVYLILLDFFTVKGNLWIGVGTLRSMVINLYHRLNLGTKKNPKRINSRWLKSRLWHFSIVIRFSLGLASQEELRRILGSYCSSNGEIVLPWDSTILMNRVLSSGLTTIVNESIAKLVKSSDQYIKYFSLFIPDLNCLSTCPILLGLYNHTKMIHEVSKTIDAGENFNLLELIKKISFLDFNKVATWDRNLFPAAVLSSKLFSSGLREMSRCKTAQDFEYGVTRKHISDPSTKLESVQFSSSRLIEKINTILNKEYKNLPPQAINAMRMMTKRHGGWAFLL